MKVIIEPRELIARYVTAKTGYNFEGSPFTAFGLLDGDDRLVAGAIFNGYKKPNIVMSIAAERITPAFMAAIMGFAFNQCNCGRVTGLVEKRNHASRKFSLHLGAKLEGCMRRASPNGDVLIYGLLREDAQKWITDKYRAKLGESSWVS